MILYREANYAGALVKFTAAYEGSKDYRLLFHMVTAEKNLCHYARAIELLDRFVEEGGDRLSPPVRAHAATLRDAMTPFVDRAHDAGESAPCNGHNDRQQVRATLISGAVSREMGSRQTTTGTLVIYAGPEDEISVDGEEVATGTFTGSVFAGAHYVVVRASGKIPYKTDVVVRLHTRTTLRVTLKDRTQDQDAGRVLSTFVGQMIVELFEFAVRGMLAGGRR